MIKNIVGFFGVPISIFAVLYFSLATSNSLDFNDYSTNGIDLCYTVNNDKIVEPEIHEQYLPYLGKSYLGFKEALGFKESRGNYFSVNDFGYLGKYQFGKETLKLIGIYTPNQFLYNPELQEKAFLANAQRNKWVLRKDIDRFVGKNINGFKVTESGILAAAHLAGPGSVKKFLRSYGRNGFSDAYGTSISSYMKRFSGYDTSEIIPNKKAKVSNI
jgi:hypothetical protein